MNISRKTAKNFAIASFILAIIDLIIVAIGALELLATTCQYPDIVKTYSESYVNFICSSILKLVIDIVYGNPLFILWLIATCPLISIILAIISIVKEKKNIWKTLAISGISIHLLVSIAILIQIQYRTFF
ncbi:MAG: hypothetical protein ACRC2R_27770 [Xenococcaceae cyanobacterium]